MGLTGSSIGNKLFTDGGVIGPNPSVLGGTWAFRLLIKNKVVAERSGVISVQDSMMPTVSNNLTEMLALVEGLEYLPVDWDGTVYADSQITLERAFSNWKWKNIPMWLKVRFELAKARLVNFERFDHILLKGHPTKNELLLGYGFHGSIQYPVSIHNQWCDKACGAEAKKFRNSHILAGV